MKQISHNVIEFENNEDVVFPDDKCDWINVTCMQDAMSGKSVFVRGISKEIITISQRKKADEKTWKQFKDEVDDILVVYGIDENTTIDCIEIYNPAKDEKLFVQYVVSVGLRIK
jgi:hypothetical protein